VARLPRARAIRGDARKSGTFLICVSARARSAAPSFLAFNGTSVITDGSQSFVHSGKRSIEDDLGAYASTSNTLGLYAAPRELWAPSDIELSRIGF